MAENKKKVRFLNKTSDIFKKINPYEDLEFDLETGKPLNSRFITYYRSFGSWICDVILDGLIVNFCLYMFGMQSFNAFLALANGLTIWFVTKAIGVMYDYYIAGQKSLR